MRSLTVHVDGQGHRGSWDIWRDEHFGQMVQVEYRGWMAQGPIHDEDPERFAEHLLHWCVARAIHGIHGDRWL